MIERYTVDTELGQVVLASDEELVDIQWAPLELPQRRRAPLDVLCHMAGVRSADELGDAGPVIASAANEENADNPEARRYEARFGRDAFYTAEFLAHLFPRLEAATVRYFAAYQAIGTNPAQQATPGKIPNHIRRLTDPLAVALSRSRGRQWPWFGAMDTTVLFLLAAIRVIEAGVAAMDEHLVYPSDHSSAGDVVRRSGRPVRLGDTIRTATRWLLRHLEAPLSFGLLWVPMNDADSFTVWTDSPNWFCHADGRLARPPVAPVQLQAQSLQALTSLAPHAQSLGLDGAELTASAQLLARALRAQFPVGAHGDHYLASAVERADGSVVPLAVPTVSLGFVLDTPALPFEDCTPLEEGIVRRLFAEDMRSTFGIVGRPRSHPRFEEFDYHSQVWAFAVYKVARGLLSRGYRRLGTELELRVLAQTADGLLPENVGGGAGPTLRYCPHVLRVARRAADGRRTVTAKERPPAPYAAWTAGAVVAVQAAPGHPPVLATVTDQALRRRQQVEDELLERCQSS